LSVDGRHIDVSAKDPRFLAKIKRTAKLPQSVNPKRNGSNQVCHRISIGMLRVQTKFFSHFLRGVIDGDGGIRFWTHPSNGREQWSLRIYSASIFFLEWLQTVIADEYAVTGKIHDNQCTNPGNYVLKYGKMAAVEILKKCYLMGDPKIYLDRKFLLAKKCADTKRGWLKSKTVHLHTARVAEQEDAWDSWDGSPPWQQGGNKLGEFGEVYVSRMR